VAALAGITAAVTVLAGCSAWQNPQAAKEAERRSEPQWSVNVGWRVFQMRCAACHGPDARGTQRGIDLLPRLRELGARQFVGLVLNRYDWTRPADANGSNPDELIDDVMARRRGTLDMPAWEAEPQVNAHILDLYAYLSARADGRLGPGRPGASR
jgi:mono/diheme cytochrome c family protein